ncbi:hypothetical protein CPter91_2882 [Collimonas pratensis]|uniref:Uncharacterized protein n=1 Tax=Collimonas pratensis TaxID=279113 RepID=A0A127Q576_9BURK|nr:hypothetical protein CPter91_2882 [Collimonas pratensis]
MFDGNKGGLTHRGNHIDGRNSRRMSEYFLLADAAWFSP